MKFIRCKKPENLDPQYVGNATITKGHTFIGRFDQDGNYYEHDTTADIWFKLIEDDEDETE